MIVADTDVLIDALAGRGGAAALIEELIRSRRLASTAITRLELGVGIRGKPEEERIGRFLAAIPILAFDGDAARLAAQVGAALGREGRTIALADLAISGICLSLDAPLLTRNRAHFERVPGLRLARLPDDE